MAIVALGMDLVKVERLQRLLEKRGDGFLERVFTQGERADCPSAGAAAQFYAGRFAVKEAVLKVLGTGWGSGIRWQEVEVQRDAAGVPSVQLSGNAMLRAKLLGIEQLLVTITHDAGLAAAMAVGER